MTTLQPSVDVGARYLLGAGDFALSLIFVFHLSVFSGVGTPVHTPGQSLCLRLQRVMTVYYADKLMDVGFRKTKRKCWRESLIAHLAISGLCRGQISRPKGYYSLA